MLGFDQCCQQCQPGGFAAARGTTEQNHGALRHRHIREYHGLARTISKLQLLRFNHRNQAIRKMECQALASRANVFLNLATLGAATARQ